MGSPREIFDSACTEIAASLAHTGLEYRPSKHTLLKTDGDLKLKIRFQSSSSNYTLADGSETLKKLVPSGDDLAAFGSVTLIEHASVRSKEIKGFRRSLVNAWRLDDGVTGNQIGNLRTPPRWIEFNLANPHSRRKVIAEALHLIENVAFPYFEFFQTPSEVIDRLLDGSIPWAWKPSALEYVCCFGHLDQSLRLLNRYVDEPPSRAAEYREALSRYKAEGIPEGWNSSLAANLAKTAIVLELDRRGSTVV